MTLRYAPLLGCTEVMRHTHASRAFDFVRYIFVREGTATVRTSRASYVVRPGDVLLFGPNLWCQKVPDGTVTFTTIYADVDYLCDMLMWQHSPEFRDRADVFCFLEGTFPSSQALLRVGVQDLEHIGGLLDAFVGMCNASSTSFLALQALFGRVHEYVEGLLSPYVFAARADDATSVESRSIRVRPVMPVRREVQALRTMLRADVSRRWTMKQLAQSVHLSPSQAHRLFLKCYGVTPLGFQAGLRAQEMARLFRETGLTVGEVAARVGWQDPGHAAAMFRRFFGVSPSQYQASDGAQAGDDLSIFGGDAGVCDLGPELRS